MLNNVSIIKYVNGSSVIHKLNPLFKILSLIIMLFSISFINSYYDILILGIYLLLSLTYSDISVKIYFRNIFDIKLILIFFFILNIIILNNIIFSLFSTLFFILYLFIITYTTSLTETIYGIGLFFKPFNNFVNVNKISMLITIIIRYIPIITIEKIRIKNAAKLRGINFNEKNLIKRINSNYSVLLPIVKSSFEREKKLISQVYLRLYGYGKSRGNYRYNKWGMLESLLLILNLLILIIVISY